jgi:prefoldin subunit 5
MKTLTRTLSSLSSRTNQLNSLVSMLQNEKLVKVGKGFYQTSKLVEMYKVFGQVGNVKNDTPAEEDSAREEGSQLKLDGDIASWRGYRN